MSGGSEKKKRFNSSRVGSLNFRSWVEMVAMSSEASDVEQCSLGLLTLKDKLYVEHKQLKRRQNVLLGTL